MCTEAEIAEVEATEEEDEKQPVYIPVITSKGLRLMELDDIADEVELWR